MSKSTPKTPEELQAFKDKYGEVVSFRLFRRDPDQAQILDALKGVPKEQKVDLFVRAMLDYMGKPIYDDNAATAAELRTMINELLQVLGSAHELIAKLSRATVISHEVQREIDDNTKKYQLSSEFITKMNQQQRAAKVLRQPSSTDEE